MKTNFCSFWEWPFYLGFTVHEIPSMIGVKYYFYIKINSECTQKNSLPEMVLLCTHNIQALYLGLHARKPVFGGLQTTKGQTSLRICTDWSAPFSFTFLEVSYLNMLQAQFQFFLASLCSWGDWFYCRFHCQKPRRQFLSRRGPNNLYPANIFVLKMLSAFYICCIDSTANQITMIIDANTMDPDQTARRGAVMVGSGSILFAITLPNTWVKVQNFPNPELLKFKYQILQYAFKILVFQV